MKSVFHGERGIDSERGLSFTVKEVFHCESGHSQ